MGAGRTVPRPRPGMSALETTDSGLAAVARVRDALALDAARVVEESRGFSCWPHAHAMRIGARPPRPDGAAVVSVETALLSGVEPGGSLYARLARRNAHEPGLSALRLDAERGEISLRAAVVTRPEDGGAAARRLAHAALLQIGAALLAADELAVELPGSTLLVGSAPGGGSWPVVEQAGAAAAYAAGAPARAGQVLSVFARLATLSPAPWLRATPAAHGLDAELPCRAASSAAGPAAEVALLRMSASQPHPRLGAGLVVALLAPPSLEPEPARAAATAALLNDAESREWTGVDQLGAWCVHPALGLAHVGFVPALAVEDSTAEALAWQAGTRARWATAFAAHAVHARALRESGPRVAAEPHQ